MISIFRRAPGFAAGTILTLVTGITLSTAGLGLVQRHFFGLPPGISNNALRRLYFVSPAQSGAQRFTSYPIFLDLQESGAFSSLAGYVTRLIPVGRGDRSWPANAAFATPEYFGVLGVPIAMGRTWSSAEAPFPDGAPVAVISTATWLSRFAGDPNVVGKSIQLGSEQFTIIGVSAGDFRGVDAEPVDLWLPVSTLARFFSGRGWERARGNSTLALIGRPLPGLPASALDVRATSVVQRAGALAGDETAEQRVLVAPLQAARGPAREGADRVIPWVAAIAVLLTSLAAMSAAGLFITRTLMRRRELAIRLAMGATPVRLVGTVLPEVVVLSVIACVVAVPMAHALVLFAERSFLRSTSAAVFPVSDLQLAALAVGSCVLVAAASGLAVMRGIDFEGLRSALGGTTHDTRASGSRIRRGLLIAQIGFSVCLTIIAAQFVGSLQNALGYELGLQPTNVALLTVPFRSAGYSGDAADLAYQRLGEELRRVSTVRSVALSSGIPTRGGGVRIGATVSGKAPADVWHSESPTAFPAAFAVTPDYFRALSMRLIAGRLLGAGDGPDAPRVAVVDSAFAATMWPGEPAVGKCFLESSTSTRCIRVVGVVADALFRTIGEETRPQVFLPMAQEPGRVRGMLIQTSTPAAATISALREAIVRIDPALPFVDLRPLPELLAPQLQPWQTAAGIGSLLSLIALCMTGIALYSLIMQSVVERTPEIGIRLALGAQRAQVAWFAFHDALRMSISGVALGGALALGPVYVLRPVLFGSGYSLAVLVGAAAAAIALVTALAVAIPVRRAAGVDPAVAMRS